MKAHSNARPNTTQVPGPLPVLGPALALSVLLALSGLFLSGLPLQAQTSLLQRISLEPRVGFASPTGDFGNVDPACPAGSSGCPYPIQIGTESGWRWGIRGLVGLNPRWSLVAEYGRSMLGCSATFCGTEKKPGIHGMSAGFRVLALPVGSMDIWVEGAGALEKVTVIRTLDEEGNPAPSTVAYPWSMGFSGGIGAELALDRRETWFFSPGFRFRYVPADPPDSQPDMTSITATYLLFELGFRMALGAG